MDMNKIRDWFPVTRQAVYLNNAAESPLNSRVRDRLNEYLDITASAQDKPSVREGVRRQLANLLGGTAEEYALVTSTGVGIAIAAGGIRWRRGDNVVLPVAEHWNNIFPWLALKEQGVDVRFVPLSRDNRVEPEAIARAVDERTRVVAVAAVRFNSGFRADLKKLSQIAHAAGALLVVDGVQAAGVIPLNVDADGIDILCCAGFKWLLGMPGTGFVYVRSTAQNLLKPVIPGKYAAEASFHELKYWEDARKFETGTLADSLFYAWSAGLDILEEIGIPQIQQRVLLLTDRIIDGLREKDLMLLSPVADANERSAILLFSAGDEAANKKIFQRLREKNILISLREGICRVSPAFFNTEEEINLFLREL